jgi:hypothetical protein
MGTQPDTCEPIQARGPGPAAAADLTRPRSSPGPDRDPVAVPSRLGGDPVNVAMRFSDSNRAPVCIRFPAASYRAALPAESVRVAADTPERTSSGLTVPPGRAPDFPGLETGTGASTPRNRRTGVCQACPAGWSASDRNEGKRRIFESRRQVFPGRSRLNEGAASRTSAWFADEPARAGWAVREPQPGARAMPWAPCSPCDSWKLRPR